MNARDRLNEAARRFAGGDYAGAASVASSVLAADPRDANALRLMGVIALHTGNPVSALDYLHRALEVDPENPRSHGTLGSALLAVGRLDDAARHATRSIELDANYADGHIVLGLVRTQQGALTPAEETLHRAIALRPNDGSAHNLLGNVLCSGGRTELAIDAYTRGIALSPSNSVIHGNLLMALNHVAGDDPVRMFDAHRDWARRHAPRDAEPVRFDVDRDPNRRLRIGYLSPDFRRHAVSCFFEPVLAARDRERFHVTLYASVEVEDEVSHRLRGLADAWHNVAGVGDDELRRRIMQNRIDVLIDLAGHTAGNRLRAMVPRAAPVQMSWLGYPNTTGLCSVDSLITDTDLDPPGAEAHHTERLIRLSRTMHCYRPPEHAPDVLPRRDPGPIRFGSFNRLEKLTDRTVELWSAVLGATPGSTLTIKSAGLADEPTRRRVIDRFAARGIAPERLELLSRDATEADHVRRYASIDVALDSYPYNGTTTTCEALWMGVPVVTLQGPTRVTRTTAGILRAIGLDRLCADTDERFVAAARGLCDAPEDLAELRVTLRERMRGSPLMDGRSLAGEIESAVRWCWATWAVRG